MKTPELGIQVPRSVVEWAVSRSGKDEDVLLREFKPIASLSGEGAVFGFGELERFAHRTNTPIGNFFLKEPPKMDLDLVEFRGRAAHAGPEASPELLETVSAVRQLQEWYKEYLLEIGEDVLPIFRSINQNMTVQSAAKVIDQHIEYRSSVREARHGYADQWAWFAELLESSGIAVMKNGVVGNNTHRPLDREEFQAFSLADKHAPVIFVNGKDEASATVFSLAHELVHIALGLQSLTRLLPEQSQLGKHLTNNQARLESWCNAVAAELLVPADDIRSRFDQGLELTRELDRLSRAYRVSRFVILIKLRDEELIGNDEFTSHYQVLMNHWRETANSPRAKGASGGDSYRTMSVRFSKTISQTLLRETVFGRVSYAEALELLRLKKATTVTKWAERLGIA